MKRKITILAVCMLLIHIVSIAQKNVYNADAAPKNTFKDAALLSQWLCQSAKSDEQRVKTIFVWITNNIKWDVKSYNKEITKEARTSEKVLKNKVAKPYEYAYLMKEMCEGVGIRCQPILGYEKNYFYTDGMHFYKPNYIWNAVLVNNKWQIVDAFNAAGKSQMQLSWMKNILQKINKKKLYYSTKEKFKAEYDESYLFQNPEEVRLTRLSADPIWQLTDSAMPLAVFEEGEEAIKDFNEHHSFLKQSLPKLSEVNNLNKDDAVLEAADRTYAFNPRYTGMKTDKHLALANNEVKKIAKAKNQLEGAEILAKAKSELTQSKELLTIQKQEINNEFTELRKINSEKKVEVVKYKQSFTTINNKFISKSTSKINSSENKINSLKSDATSKAKKGIIKAQKIEISAKAKAIELKPINDSIAKNATTIATIENQLLELKTFIAETKVAQDKNLELLGVYMTKSDSAFYKEAVARSKKQDSFSDSIKNIRNDINFYKTVMVDSLQNEYLVQYDTIVASYETIKKLNGENITTSKYSVNYLEQYIKKASNAAELLPSYNENTEQYATINRNYINNSISYINYLKEQKEYIQKMKKVYELENKYFTYLTNTEDDRKELIKKSIDKQERVQKKNNEFTKELVVEYKKSLDTNMKKISLNKKRKTKK